MYEDFFELTEKPFSLTPDPKFFYLSESHRIALEHLIYGITQREGFMLITGEVGTGKTTLCRSLIEKLDSKTKTALIVNPQAFETNILDSILTEFEIPHSNSEEDGAMDKLNNFLLQTLASGGISVLIIDEGQTISIDVMEKLRLLSNLETEKDKLLQIILLGQPELKAKLKLPNLRQLNQRISVRYELMPLDKTDTPKYIEHRLMVAGAKGGIRFSSGAISRIYKHSNGIPRLVNLIADRCMLGGYSKQTSLITTSIAKEAINSVWGEDIVSLKSPFFSYNKLKYACAGLLGLLLMFGAIQVKAIFTHKDPDPSPILEKTSIVENNDTSSNIAKPLEDKIDISDVHTTNDKESIEASDTEEKVDVSAVHIRNDKEEVEAPVTEKEDVFNGYTIHLESYADEEPALNMAEIFRQRGYDSRVVPSNISEKEHEFQLLLGKFNDKTHVDDMMHELEVNGILAEFPYAIPIKSTF
ncbi:MAG: AAA family ATPase [Candidatus Anammoxibacter sp.]